MRGRFETPCETCQGLKPSRPPLIAFVVRVLIALLVVVGWLLWSPTNAEAVLNSLPNETPHFRIALMPTEPGNVTTDREVMP
jgi:hypothetical protein